MKIRESQDFADGSRFDGAAAEETLLELEEQHARGEIETHAYFMKKRSLVRLFLKSTTRPKRRYYDEYDGD